MIEKNRTNLIYFFCYLSLLVGFYFNEDTAGGQIQDYNTHLALVEIFQKGIIKFLLDYDSRCCVAHSPFHIIYMLLLKELFFYETIARLINLHLVLFIPLFFYKSLELISEFNNNNLKKILPALLFLSPYFRSGAIWIDDNILGLLFFTISVYFFLKSKKNNYKSFLHIFLNVFFLALSAYFRPIFSIFSIFFFFEYLLNIKKKTFILYIFLNLIISLPAIYYVFILEINLWISSHITQTNILTLSSLSVSVIIFYLAPLVSLNYKIIRKNIKINYFIIIISTLYFFLLYAYFNYPFNYSGGIIYRILYSILKNNLVFIAFISVIFYLIILYFYKSSSKRYSDILIFVLLITTQVSGIIYHKFYDPLIWIVVFLMLKGDFFVNYKKKFNIKKIKILFIFSSTFYICSIIKNFI